MNQLYRTAAVVFTAMMLTGCALGPVIMAPIMTGGIVAGESSLSESSQKLIPETEIKTDELDSVKTIALLSIPDLKDYDKDTAEFGEFNFGAILHVYLKQFMEENGYEVIEYDANRVYRHRLKIDYQRLDIKGADAYLDVVPVEVEYGNISLDDELGPYVSAVVRLVSADTNKVIYAGSVQYGSDVSRSISGIIIEAPEDHRFKSYEALKAKKGEAIEGLVRGIEAVSLNIVKKISKGEFVSVLSFQAFEFYGEAEDEINNNTYIKNVWDRVLVETGGDQNKTKAKYIELRANQLYSEKIGSVSDASLGQQATPITPDTLGSQIDISGTYKSVIRSNKGEKKNPVVILTQSGGKITGVMRPDNGDRINGTITGSTVKFRWIVAGGAYDRTGVWKVNNNVTQLKGDWANFGNTTGTWILTKTE